MTILAMLLRILGLAPEIIQDVLQLIIHAKDPANHTAATQLVQAATTKK